MKPSFHLFVPATLVLIAWGAFAFGAEYTWAYAALLVFSIAVSSLGFLAGLELPDSTVRTYRGPILALLLVICAAAFQLAPLPASFVETLSPSRNNADYARLYKQANWEDVNASTSPQPARTLSIEPSRTRLGLIFLVPLSLLLIATARGVSAVRPTTLIKGIIMLGVVAAFAEIIQKASDSRIVYGLFIPRQMKYESAPFVNRNHTAGWLIMVLGLALGHLAGCVARGMRGVKPQWRERVLWLSTKDAGETVLTGFATAIIAIAVVLTESRSGSLCLIATALMFGWISVRQQSGAARRLFALANVVLMIVAAAIMGGAAVVAQRFAVASADVRPSIWRDTLAIIRDFAATGTGLNTYGISMLHYQRSVQDGFFYIEAHNDYLQLASEGGLLLGIPIIILFVAIVVTIRRRFAAAQDDTRLHWIRQGAVISLCAVAIQSLVDFTLQMPGAAVLFVLILAIAIHKPARTEAVKA